MSEVRPDPPDVPGEDERPDLDLLLAVVKVLLSDLIEHLDGERDDTKDLRLRARAVRGVVKRLWEVRNGGE